MPPLPGRLGGVGACEGAMEARCPGLPASPSRGTTTLRSAHTRRRPCWRRDGGRVLRVTAAPAQGEVDTCATRASS